MVQCIFSILNWFYLHSNWGISVEKVSVNLINKGSELLINEFPQMKTSY